MKTDYRISKTLLSDKTAMNNILKTMVIIVAGVVLFIFYINFVTYKGELSGEQLLYVKMDGKTGSVLKVNNKYLKNEPNITLYIFNESLIGLKCVSALLS